MKLCDAAVGRIGMCSVVLAAAAGSASAQLLDDGGLGQSRLAGVIYVNVRTGERVVTTFGDRMGAPIWSNTDTAAVLGQYHAIDGRSRNDGRNTYNSLSLGWGDIAVGPHIDGVEIGYAVPETLASRFPDPGDPNYGKIFGFNLFYAIWANENGQHDGSVNEQQLGLLLPFPDAYGAVPEGNAWRVIFDLEGATDFDLLATDQDGDGKVDFGFGYSFRQKQHQDPRNSPPIARAAVGPLLVLPGNAGGEGFPPSNGVEDALDWYNTFDADFVYNPALPGYETDGNRTLSRSNFAGTYFFSGDPYAAYYTRLFGSIRGCQGDFNNDGFIDFFDYDDFVNCFENTLCPPGRNADVNGDRFVDFFDYDDFVSSFELGC